MNEAPCADSTLIEAVTTYLKGGFPESRIQHESRQSDSFERFTVFLPRRKYYLYIFRTVFEHLPVPLALTGWLSTHPIVERMDQGKSGATTLIRGIHDDEIEYPPPEERGSTIVRRCPVCQEHTSITVTASIDYLTHECECDQCGTRFTYHARR